MEWYDYYERVGDWAESTRVRRISDLTEFGDSDEVLDAATNFEEEKNASKFINKALACGVRFTTEEVVELISIVDRTTLTQVAKTAVGKYTQEQLDNLTFLIDNDVLDALESKHLHSRQYSAPATPTASRNTASQAQATPAAPKRVAVKHATMKDWAKLFKAMGSLGRTLNPKNFMPLTYREKRTRAQAKARRNRPWWDK